jgi:hypothetical protein
VTILIVQATPALKKMRGEAVRWKSFSKLEAIVIMQPRLRNRLLKTLLDSGEKKKMKSNSMQQRRMKRRKMMILRRWWWSLEVRTTWTLTKRIKEWFKVEGSEKISVLPERALIKWMLGLMTDLVLYQMDWVVQNLKRASRLVLNLLLLHLLKVNHLEVQVVNLLSKIVISRSGNLIKNVRRNLLNQRESQKSIKLWYWRLKNLLDLQETKNKFAKRRLNIFLQRQ